MSIAVATEFGLIGPPSIHKENKDEPAAFTFMDLMSNNFMDFTNSLSRYRSYPPIKVTNSRFRSSCQSPVRVRNSRFRSPPRRRSPVRVRNSRFRSPSPARSLSSSPSPVRVRNSSFRSLSCSRSPVRSLSTPRCLSPARSLSTPRCLSPARSRSPGRSLSMPRRVSQSPVRSLSTPRRVSQSPVRSLSTPRRLSRSRSLSRSPLRVVTFSSHSRSRPRPRSRYSSSSSSSSSDCSSSSWSSPSSSSDWSSSSRSRSLSRSPVRVRNSRFRSPVRRVGRSRSPVRRVTWSPSPTPVRRRRPRTRSRSPSLVSRSRSRSSSCSRSPVRGLTENGSATYIASGNPLLDFFFHVVPDTPHKSMTRRLESAWKHDPLAALKLICNLRGVRGTGKSIKEGFYAAALWLHNNHPKTLAANLKAISDFGYLKDLPEILYRLHEGVDIREVRKREWKTEKCSYPLNDNGKRVYPDPKCNRKSKQRKTEAGSKLCHKEKPEKKSRNDKAIEMSKKAFERYGKDTEYRNLHDGISGLFAELLISDLKCLSSGELGKITLASKWCPSLNSCLDKSTLICESIARRIFPRNSNPDYENIEEAHYAYRIRDRLRREYLVPLRKVLELPEVYMSSKKWESLPYNRVSSVAMKKYKTFFEKHDNERFNEYLESVKKGESKIAAGALLPHEILASLSKEDQESDCNVAELQWQRMVDDMSKTGKLNDCLAICDVSASMSGTPMDVCVALGLLISEMCQEPWKGKLITFSSEPTLQEIKGDNLRSKIESIKRMDWQMSTDFQKVFDQILQVAVNGNLKEEQMIKKLFVFSDMEFDEASGKHEVSRRAKRRRNDWETDYQLIEKKFRDKGYMNVPDIVFWNLRDSSSTPVVAQRKGVALVSGYSKNLLTLFLEGSDLGELTPIRVMEKAISGKEYDKLVLVD